MSAARSAAKGISIAFCVAPWAWLILLAVFAAWVTLSSGHFPSYSRPDPKHAGAASVLHLPTMLLLAPVLASPLVLGAFALLRRRWPFSPSRPLAGVYLTGLALCLAVVFGNAFGLMSWLLD